MNKYNKSIELLKDILSHINSGFINVDDAPYIKKEIEKILAD